MKKTLALLLAAVMVLALGACGVSNEAAPAAPAAAPAAPAANNAAPAAPAAPAAAPAAASTGIRLFNGKIEIGPALDHAAEVYEAATGKHVEIESLGGGVDLQATLKQYYQAGNMPDIFVFEGQTDMDNWTGMVVDMAGWDWTKDTDAAFVNDEGTVGFPYTTEAIGFAYNKSILEKAGIDPATLTGPASIEAALAELDAKKAELGITAAVGYCANATELYWSTGQHLFNSYLDGGLARDDSTYFDLLMDGGKLDEARFTDFAKFVGVLNKYSDPALLVSGNYDMQVSGFAAGKYAFVTQGSWIGASLTNQYKDQYAAAGNFECGYIPYAFQDGIDTIMTNAPSDWAVYKDGNVEEAKEFLNWIASQDGQKIMVEEAGCVSPFKSVNVEYTDPFAPAMLEYVQAGKTSAWHFLSQPGNLAQDFTGILFQDYAAGSLDTEGFVKAMQQVIPNCING